MNRNRSPQAGVDVASTTSLKVMEMLQENGNVMIKQNR
jgi:hypothetical protein